MLSYVSRIVGEASVADWAIVALAMAALVYWLGTFTYGHFAKRGMPFEKPKPFIGNMAPTLFRTKHFNDWILDMYKKNEGQHAFGVFQFFKPTLVIRDPELIKLISVKEFDHFVNHLPLTLDANDPIFARNLFSLADQEWRDMRATLSPAFTSSKMRNIFKLMHLCGEQMVDFLRNEVSTSAGGVYEAEMKDFFTRVANDVIATTAFGIECDSLRQPKNEFYVMGRELTDLKGFRGILLFLHQLFPKVMQVLRIPVTSQRVSSFFHGIVHDTIRERQKKGIVRPDMMQLLIQAREGELRAEADGEAGDEQEHVKGAKHLELTDDDVTAQAVIFFFAGFDTVSTAMSFCAHALAIHPEEQRRAQREADEAFARSAGARLTYEAVHALKYLDMFISEVLRLYASVPSLDRVCTKDFTIPAVGDAPEYTIRKGEVVWFPAVGLHMDPKYWDEPDRFLPERFSDDNKHNITPYTYMPFGLGPRICIGSRFALMEVKLALAHMLHNFNVIATEKTAKRIEYDCADFNISLKNGFWVGFEERNQ